MRLELPWRLGGSTDAAAVRLTMHTMAGSAELEWADLADLDWTDFSLVLGAGGTTGFAFEVGTLLAMSTDHGVEFSSAAVLVGTSAGSIVASLVGLGFDAGDLAAVVVEADSQVSAGLASLGVHFSDETPGIPGPLGWFRWPTFGSTATGVGRLLRRRFTAAALNTMRSGEFDLAEHLDFLEGIDWPSGDSRLRVCAVNAESGERTVFDTTSQVSLYDAVVASCAIPGVMRPPIIDGVAYVDGGVMSPTNSDVVVDDRANLVVVVSPMSGAHSRTATGALASMHARFRLSSELRSLVQRDHKVLVVEPMNDLSVMVLDAALDGDRASAVLAAAFVRSATHISARPE